jgi:phenylpyruvate tautomerase PptA (4-oxalocrotonate tautomerase family)
VPVCRIEAPPGVGIAAKKKMVEKITAAIDEAYHIGDTLVFLQECAPGNVAMTGDCCRKIQESRKSCRRLVPEPIRSRCSPYREPFSAAHDTAGTERSPSS